MKNILIFLIIALVSKSVGAQVNVIPIGGVIAFSGEVKMLKDPNWTICDGRSVEIKQYIDLFKTIGWTYGLGNDSTGRTTFSLPDYRGQFLRGVSGTSGNDPDTASRLNRKDGYPVGDRIGSLQKDALQSHKHDDRGHTHVTTATNSGGEVESDNSDERAAPPNGKAGEVLSGKADLTDPTDSSTGAGTPRLSKETRPKNISVYWIIRIK